MKESLTEQCERAGIPDSAMYTELCIVLKEHGLPWADYAIEATERLLSRAGEDTSLCKVVLANLRKSYAPITAQGLALALNSARTPQCDY